MLREFPGDLRSTCEWFWTVSGLVGTIGVQLSQETMPRDRFSITCRRHGKNATLGRVLDRLRRWVSGTAMVTPACCLTILFVACRPVGHSLSASWPHQAQRAKSGCSTTALAPLRARARVRRPRPSAPTTTMRWAMAGTRAERMRTPLGRVGGTEAIIDRPRVSRVSVRPLPAPRKACSGPMLGPE